MKKSEVLREKDHFRLTTIIFHDNNTNYYDTKQEDVQALSKISDDMNDYNSDVNILTCECHQT